MFRSRPLLQKPTRLSKRVRIPSARITKLKHPSLPELIDSLPKPVIHYPADLKDRTTWRHKYGKDMKFFRTDWRFPEPTYYTVTKYRPANQHQRPKVWGRLTWRGVENEASMPIPMIFKKQWRYIPEAEWPPADFKTLQDKLLDPPQETETEQEVSA